MGTKTDNFLNWETLYWANQWDTQNGPIDGGDTSGDVDANNNVTDSSDIELPDQHVMAVHGFEVDIGDPADNSHSAGDKLDLWFYNEQEDDPQGWFRRMQAGDEPLFHYSIQVGSVDGSGDPAEVHGTNETWRPPLPLLNPDGEVGVIHSGSASGSAGEVAVTMYYDVVPINDTERYLELLLKR